MRILNFLLTIGFLVLAFLHVDLPHPVLWILLYGALAITSIFSAFQYFPRKIFYIMLAVLAGSLVYALSFLPFFPETLENGTLLLFFTSQEFVPLRLLLFIVVVVVQLLQSYKTG
jgi:hypothetical protein